VPSVGKYVKLRAKPGRGTALARKLLEVAGGLREPPGCELYVINRSRADPDVVWVTELWRSQGLLDASLDREETRAMIPEVQDLLAEDGFERIDVEPLGGVGHEPRVSGFAVVNLDEVKDMAPEFGLGDMGESRFARGALEAVGLGVSLQRLRPGVRQSFGHSHHRDEEVYVVLAGSGRLAVDDQVREIERLDAIRVAPGSTRAFEAGDDGLELLAIGTHHAGDSELEPGFWPE
jgi:quinol monooxygenase YgiN/mannose-6-phosphate isomerase-like protein (cupin superfamily)